MLKKLEHSIKNEFYFESLFILASVIENRTKNIMKKTNNSKSRISFEDSIEFLFEKNIISKSLYHKLHNWREKRNNLVHNLVLKTIDEEKL
jgi:hypothetical protein